jgi:hypothetical protein
MSSINVNELGSKAASEIARILTGAGKDVAEYAQAEGKKLATSAAEIAALFVSGTITQEEARLHLSIQKHASRSVLLAIAGVSLVAAEQAINAALNIIKEGVKGAIGIPLFG